MQKTEEKDAQAQTSINAIIFMIMGVGIATLMLIFVGVLGGATFSQNEADISALYGKVIAESVGSPNSSGGGVYTVTHVPIVTLTSVYCGTSAVPAANLSNTQTTITITNHKNECNSTGLTVTANYTYGNHTIEASIQGAVGGGFEGLETTGGYLPLVVLAVIIVLVMSMVLGMGGSRGGSAEGMAL